MVVRKRALSEWAMIKRDVSTYLKISSRNLLHHCFFLALTSRVLLRYYPSTLKFKYVCVWMRQNRSLFWNKKKLETPHSFNPFNPTIEFYFQWIIKFRKNFFHIHNPLQWHSSPGVRKCLNFILCFSLLPPPTTVVKGIVRDKEKKANPLKAKSLNLSGLMKTMRIHLWKPRKSCVHDEEKLLLLLSLFFVLCFFFFLVAKHFLAVALNFFFLSNFNPSYADVYSLFSYSFALNSILMIITIL